MAYDSDAAIAELDVDITPEDVIGHRIYHPGRGLGLGKAEDRKVVQNGYGEERDVFVCRVGGEQGSETVYRNVSTVMQNLANLGYQLCNESLEVVIEV